MRSTPRVARAGVFVTLVALVLTAATFVPHRRPRPPATVPAAPVHGPAVAY
ncbi:hypothetical protein AB0F85_19815 [Nocardia fluminea]|uniref:hypothetical protein n=1 Tax=Nocardia fluminea TaxID=134984 RepID=UPI003405CBA8